jgi:hypothetical protein
VLILVGSSRIFGHVEAVTKHEPNARMPRHPMNRRPPKCSQLFRMSAVLLPSSNLSCNAG